jgi:hypothetical protein
MSNVTAPQTDKPLKIYARTVQQVMAAATVRPISILV